MLEKTTIFLYLVCIVHTDHLTKETVRDWASKVEDYLVELAKEGLRTKELQRLYDEASYVAEQRDGKRTVEAVKEKLGGYFSKKEKAAKTLAAETAKLIASVNKTVLEDIKSVRDLPSDVYSDADLQNYNPVISPKYNTLFKQTISLKQSSVKISDQTPRDNAEVIKTIAWSSGLDKIFVQNLGNDSDLRWQYFGSNNGLYRMYPGREWQTNFAGFYEDYDPRVRPWYIAATSGPKDVVIVLDCSHSMSGKKFNMAKSIAITVLNTLTKQDYVNVICGREPYYDEVGKFIHEDVQTNVLSCQQNRLVPASTSHRKDLIAKIKELKAAGATKLKNAFEKSFDLLTGNTGTRCQSFIIFITDGQDTDGDKVRCEKGYYTRSGYVPGKKCQYDWDVVWDNVKLWNTRGTRIFSYLVVDDGEEFPGKLACDNRGFMKKIVESTNLISQMQDYYDFLTANTQSTANITWSPPYLDALGLGLMVTAAIPVVTNRTLGVIGIDVTLEEIENILTRYTWGSAYAFLINNEGETIFHPLLRPSTQLVDDPIFVDIKELEKPGGDGMKDFTQVIKEMKEGKTGSKRIENADRALPKGDFQDGLKYIKTPVTYFYTGVPDSSYSFAFSFTDSDLKYRRPDRPGQAVGSLPKNFYGYMRSYNDSYVRKELGPVFEILDLQFNVEDYPELYISRNHSSVFIAPRAYCNPNKYLFNDNSSQLTVDIHKLINDLENSSECNVSGTLLPGSVRSDVLITAPIETAWKARNRTILKDVRWTYVATTRGAFRSYPGHRSPKNFDPTRRPWYHRTIVNPSKTSVSNAYMDLNGIGKVITISQAVFEKTESNVDCSRTTKHGGCSCSSHDECLSRYCRNATCTGDRVEAVVALDIKYRDFHESIYERLRRSGGEKACGETYLCPDGVHQCETRCYLVDNAANLVTDPDFLEANITDEREYQRVSLGRKEGDIMKQLVQEQKVYEQTHRFDYQGICSVSPYFPKVTLKGIIQTPEEEDEYYRNRGPIPPFQNEYGCIQDVVGYAALFEDNKVFTGHSSGPCTVGNYFFTSLPKTNLYLLVIENWSRYRQSYFYNFNCRISNQVFDAGAYRIVNGTCKHIDHSSSKKETCPKLREIKLKCTYNGCRHGLPSWLILFISLLLVRVYS
ncbi:voltage-dependent calcium channel subunit alpha-2/delta-1-like isoform X1 [Dendronephthya gigantea]|uniref:voltage-dependent calcium channel subunit alpha-2/delta-1-like isoform X1 n=1 Tax=Dendronephthya gigantea TaxID=151771 RepID=UPI00106D51DC|nr:voltage-dependent calcium channel subunit alpha-2/delta-1-like isoform X1 [Dendronephthya gigantea]